MRVVKQVVTAEVIEVKKIAEFSPIGFKPKFNIAQFCMEIVGLTTLFATCYAVITFIEIIK